MLKLNNVLQEKFGVINSDFINSLNQAQTVLNTEPVLGPLKVVLFEAIFREFGAIKSIVIQDDAAKNANAADAGSSNPFLKSLSQSPDRRAPPTSFLNNLKSAELSKHQPPKDNSHIMDKFRKLLFRVINNSCKKSLEAQDLINTVKGKQQEKVKQIAIEEEKKPDKSIDEVLKREEKLKAELMSLRKHYDNVQAKALQDRKSYMQEVQILRDGVKQVMTGGGKDKEALKQIKNTMQNTLKVHTFDGMAGIPPQMTELLNEKLNLCRIEAEQHLAEKELKIEELTKRLEDFETTDSSLQVLIKEPIEDIAKALNKIYTDPETILTNLIQTAPEHHYDLVISEIVNGDLITDEIKKALFDKLNDTTDENKKFFERQTAEYTQKLAWVLNYRSEMKKQINKIRSECNTEMERQIEIYEKNLADIVRKDKMLNSLTFMTIKHQLQHQIEDLQAKNEKLQEQVEFGEMKYAFQKYQIHVRVLRFIDETSNCQDERRDLYRQQCQGELLGLSEAMQKVKNSLINAEAKLKDAEEKCQLKEVQVHKLKVEKARLCQEVQQLKERLDVKMNDEESFAEYCGRAMVAKADIEIKYSMLKDKFQQCMALLKKQSEIREEVEFKYGVKKRDPNQVCSKEQFNSVINPKDIKLIMDRMEFAFGTKCMTMIADTEKIAEEAIMPSSAQKEESSTQTELRDIRQDIKVFYGNCIGGSGALMNFEEGKHVGCQTDIDEHVFTHFLEQAYQFQVLIFNRAVKGKSEEHILHEAEEYLEMLVDGNVQGQVLTHDSIAISKYLQRLVISDTVSGNATSPHGTIASRKSTRFNVSSKDQQKNARLKELEDRKQKLKSRKSGKSKTTEGDDESDGDLSREQKFSDDDEDKDQREQAETFRALQALSAQSGRPIPLDQLKQIADQRTAVNSFEMYVELLKLMMKMDPDLYEICRTEIKSNMYPQFKLRPPEQIQKLYPSFVPDVFKRLWSDEPDPKIQMKRQLIEQNVKQRWKTQIEGQDHLSDQQALLPTVIESKSSAHLQIVSRLPEQELKVTNLTPRNHMPGASSRKFTRNKRRSCLENAQDHKPPSTIKRLALENLKNNFIPVQQDVSVLSGQLTASQLRLGGTQQFDFANTNSQLTMRSQNATSEQFNLYDPTAIPHSARQPEMFKISHLNPQKHKNTLQNNKNSLRHTPRQAW